MPRPFTYLQYLPAFEATARLGSVRAAANELNLSPSAISLQLKKLSETTNISLFEKAGRNVTLTSEGRDFSQATALVLSQLEIASRASENQNPLGSTKSLTISLPASLGIAGLSGALVEFAERSHLPNLRIIEASGASDVDWQLNDIAVVYDSAPFPGKFWRLLTDVALRPVCSPIIFPKLDLGHRDRKLKAIPLLHEDQGEEWTRWAVAARINLHGSPLFKMGSVAQAVASAAQGHGVALVSDVLTRHYLNEGRLMQPFSTSINAAHEYYVLCAPSRSDEPIIKALIEMLLDYFRKPRDQRG